MAAIGVGFGMVDSPKHGRKKATLFKGWRLVKRLNLYGIRTRRALLVRVLTMVARGVLTGSDGAIGAGFRAAGKPTPTRFFTAHCGM